LIGRLEWAAAVPDGGHRQGRHSSVPDGEVGVLSQLISSLAPSDWIELVALLASVAGLLVVGASLVVGGTPASGVRRDRAYSAQREALLSSAIRRRGVLLLACGGGCFALAELVEMLAR
jgi:hypothetical protein